MHYRHWHHKAVITFMKVLRIGATFVSAFCHLILCSELSLINLSHFSMLTCCDKLVDILCLSNTWSADSILFSSHMSCRELEFFSSATVEWCSVRHLTYWQITNAKLVKSDSCQYYVLQMTVSVNRFMSEDRQVFMQLLDLCAIKFNSTIITLVRSVDESVIMHSERMS